MIWECLAARYSKYENKLTQTRLRQLSTYGESAALKELMVKICQCTNIDRLTHQHTFTELEFKHLNAHWHFTVPAGWYLQ